MDVYFFHLMPYQDSRDPVAVPLTADRFDPDVGSSLYETYVSQLVYAEELGYDGVAFNEHHYRAFGLIPAPNLLATDIAGQTSTVDIALYGNILPLRDNPVRLAEELAMADNLADGRLVSGFVRGLPNEYEAYGIDRAESRGRFEEAWELIVRAWTEPDPFDFSGEFYEYEDVFIWPRPLQDPHPPLRLPGSSEASIRMAVEESVPTARVFCSTTSMVDTFELYRSIAAEHDWSPSVDKFEAARLVYVAESMERAREEAEEHVEFFYRNLLTSAFRTAAVQRVGDEAYEERHADQYRAVMEDMVPDYGEQWLRADFDELQESGEIIVGDPSYVTAEIERQYEATDGFGTLIALLQFGTLPDELTRKNMELFADGVLPDLEAI